MQFYTILNKDVQELIPPILAFSFLYFFFSLLWFLQWFQATSFDPFHRPWRLNQLSMTPYLHSVVTAFVISKALVVFFTGLQLTQIHFFTSSTTLSKKQALLISCMYSWVEGFEFYLVLLACKGWKITRTKLHLKEWIQTTIIAVSIVASALWTIVLPKIYSLWIITLYILTQRLCFTSLEFNLNYMFSFLTPRDLLRFPNLLHPGSITAIRAKRDFFLMLRLLLSAWLVILALREILFLSLDSNDWIEYPGFRIALYESADVWMFATFVYHLRFRPIPPLLPIPFSTEPTPVSTRSMDPETALFDFRPGPKASGTQAYLLLYLPSLNTNTKVSTPLKYLATRLDLKDIHEESQYLALWSLKQR